MRYAENTKQVLIKGNIKMRNFKKMQSGRSMLEILAVLAIIGVLSIGGVTGYNIAMRRVTASKILDTALKFSAQDTGSKPGADGVLKSSLKSAGLDTPRGISYMKLKYKSVGKVVCISFADDKDLQNAFETTAAEYIIKCADCCDAKDITLSSKVQ